MATPFQPTCKLRFVAREHTVSREASGGGTEKRTSYVLQQLWYNDAGSEWRDVPTEKESVMIERRFDDEAIRAAAEFIGEPLPAMLWDDGTHVHACEGARMVPFDPGTFLVWTKCGRDVPANAATRGGPQAEVTCVQCASSSASEGR